MEVMTSSGMVPVDRHGVGGNNPPVTPYEALKAHIDDLYSEAVNFLDGDPIETDEQAAAVSKLLDDARKAKTAAEAQRKIEAKPFDDGKAAVQALWTPLTKDTTGLCDLIAATAKKALAPFLRKKEDEQRAAALAATQEAEEKAAAARKAAEAVAPDDLAGQAAINALREDAAATAKAAGRLDKAKAHAKGGERAIGLVDVWTPILTTPADALRHYRAVQPEALKQWLVAQAIMDVRAGKREIPGFEIKHERVAR